MTPCTRPKPGDARQAAICVAMSLGIHDDAPFELAEPRGRPSLVEEPRDLIDRVRVALVSLGFDPRQLRLEQDPLGTVRGVIIASRFAHQSQLSRQGELRDQLERELGPEAIHRIGVFVTLTPAEAE